MYTGAQPFEIYPIGVVRNNLRRSPHDFGVLGKEDISRIELIPTQINFMYKLEDEKNITVVYYLHQARPVRSVFKRGLDGKEVGVFASRTPDRLSKIGIQDVRLIRIEETTLYVKGLDAVDGSPVLDIKLELPRKRG
jgi:tRNA (Thr-GGU) A37 N-methylase